MIINELWGKQPKKSVNESSMMREDNDLQIGDTVRVRKTTFAGRTGTVKDVGRGGMFVVVEIPGVGIKSFDSSDVMQIVNQDDWDEEGDMVAGRHYSDWDSDDIDESMFHVGGVSASDDPVELLDTIVTELGLDIDVDWDSLDPESAMSMAQELVPQLRAHAEELNDEAELSFYIDDMDDPAELVDAIGMMHAAINDGYSDDEEDDDFEESAKPAYGSDWEHRWNPSMEESLESQSDDIVDDMDQEEMGLHEGGTQGPHWIEKDCGMVLWQMGDYHYVITKAAQPFEVVKACPDCSYEEAKEMFDELCSVNSESAEPAYGSDWEKRWNPSMEEGWEETDESAEPAWGTDWVHRWRNTMESIEGSQGVSNKRPFSDKQRLDERSGPLKIVRWAKPWRDAGRDGLNARGDAKAEPWSQEWNPNYKGNGIQGPKDDNGPIQQRQAVLNPEYDTDYVKDYNPAFTQDGHDEPFIAKNPAPLDAGQKAPQGTEDNELVNVDGNIQPVKRNVQVVMPPNKLKMPIANPTKGDEIYNNKLSYWKGKEKKDLPRASQMIPIGKSEVAALIYDQDENYWNRTGSMPVKEAKIRARLKEGFVARFGKKRFNEKQLDEAIYAIVEQYIGVKKLTEDQIGIMACQVLKKLKK